MLVSNIILPIAVTLLLGAVSYCVGFFISCFSILRTNTEQEEPEFESLFRRIAIGALAITASYAICRTAGQTILLGVCIPFAVALCWRAKRLRFSMIRPFRRRRHRPSIAAFLCFAAAVVLLIATNYLQSASLAGDVFDMNQDYAYYASVAHNLAELGIEASVGDFANPEMVAPSLYHYTELWLTACVAACSGIPLYYTLLLVVFPFFGALALLGIGALTQRVLAGGRWLPIAAMWIAAMLTLLFFRLFLYKTFDLQITPFAYSSLMMQRFYPILIAFVFALTEKGWRKIAILALTGYLYPTAIAPLLAGLAAYLAFEFLRTKQRDPDFYLSATIVVSSALFGYAFYALTDVPNSYQRESYSIALAFEMAIHQFGALSMLQYATLPLADMVANIAPYAVLFVMIQKEKRSVLLRLGQENSCLLFVVLASVGGFASIWYIRDSVQMYYSVAYPLFLIANSLLLLLCLSKGTWPQRGVAIVLIAVNIALALPQQQQNKRVLDQKFYTEIAAVLKADTSEHRFAWVEFKELRNTPDILLRDAAYRKPLYAISRFENGYSPVRLDIYEIEYDPGDVGEKQIIASIENNSFYRYTIKNKLQKNILEAQNSYIRAHKIRYVIVPRGLNWFEGRGFKIQRVIESQSESYSFYVLEL